MNKFIYKYCALTFVPLLGSLFLFFFAFFFDYTVNLPISGGIFLVFLLIRNEKYKKKHFIILILAVFIEITTTSTFSFYYLENNKNNAKTLIKSIETFKTKNGKYPDKIEDLTQKYINEIPKPLNSSKYYYNYYFKDDSYTLSFSHFFLVERITYYSNKQEWN